MHVANALDYAHSQNLVHRDVKPSNVMLQNVTATATKSGAASRSGKRAILMDFGIARIVSGGAGLTQSGVAIGTLDYMAPEQIRAASDVDGRADIYALGVMAYQMLTGKLAFSGENPGVIIFAHLQRPTPDPCELEPTLPDRASQAIRRALEKDPTMRYPSAGALADALMQG